MPDNMTVPLRIIQLHCPLIPLSNNTYISNGAKYMWQRVYGRMLYMMRVRYAISILCRSNIVDAVTLGNDA